MMSIPWPAGYGTIKRTGFSGQAATAALADGTSLELRFLGRSRALQQQYSLLQFEILADGGAAKTVSLNVGAPVFVMAQTGAPIEGLFVPRAALAQAPNGQTVVFVHVEPEVFMPRAVRAETFDQQTALITSGLEDGDKIVVQNAPLVNQVR